MNNPLDGVHIIKKMLEDGLITRRLLTRVILLCRKRKVDIVKVLSNYAKMSQDDIILFSTKHFELAKIDLNDIIPNPEVIKMAPLDSILSYKMIPIFQIRGTVHIVISNPFNWTGLCNMRRLFNGKCRFMIAPEFQIINVINNEIVTRYAGREAELV